MILLNAEERRQWEAAVATWPHVHDRYCNGLDCSEPRAPQPVYIVIEGEVVGETTKHWAVPARWRVPVGKRYWRCGDCDYVPQQTHIADKERGPGQSMMTCPRCRGDHTWTYDPSPKPEPCEIRAECPHLPWHDGWHSCDTCEYSAGGRRGSVLLASAATVEVLPVHEMDGRTFGDVAVYIDCDDVPWLVEDYADQTRLTLDPLPVPGRHWVVVLSDVEVRP